MCSLYTSIFSNLFQILVLCYLTLKCFQISNVLYISTYKLCVLALVFKNKKVKISKATPWFLKHDKGVIFFFTQVRGECGWNFSELLTGSLSDFKYCHCLYCSVCSRKAVFPFFQTRNWNNPRSTFESQRGLHMGKHFTEPQMKTTASLYIFF